MDHDKSRKLIMSVVTTIFGGLYTWGGIHGLRLDSPDRIIYVVIAAGVLMLVGGIAYGVTTIMSKEKKQ